MITKAKFLCRFLLAACLCGSTTLLAQENQSFNPANLDQLLEYVKANKTIPAENVGKSIEIIKKAVESEPAETVYAQLNKLQEYRKDAIIPSARTPINHDNLLEREILTHQIRLAQRINPAKVIAHAGADNFPGSIPDDVARVTDTMEINLDRPGWHNIGMYGNPRSPYWYSTGLYAAPGELIKVTVPETAAGKGLVLRIGCHSDQLWRLQSWRRAPDICSRYQIKEPITYITNAFGGLIYVEAVHTNTYGTVKFTIENAVKAPFFVLGSTTNEDWKKIRNNPAPWAEFASDKLIISVPSSVAKKVDNPQELIEFWDKAMDYFADLLGKDHQRKRVERFVCDLQISAGYMHSGYPLMAGLDIAEGLCTIDIIKGNKHGGIWGLFHEIGHNHQRTEWTFGGTTEVTVNLFSLYLMEKVCGLPTGGHSGVTERSRTRAMTQYFANENGPDFEQWKRDPFLALAMYIQLQQEFGWEPFTKTFTEYRESPQSELPRTDNDKRDQWMVRFSRNIGKNLGPFFQAWGVPTTQQARESIADLPIWLPEGFLGKTSS